jgi:hypothetical protein
MYEAWMKLHPNSRTPQGGFFEEAIDLSSDYQTDKLIALIKGTPPSLIVLDALVDMIGDLDDDRSKDMNRFFRNVWRIARANDSSILITHHTPWESNRERGSTAIRAKSDIVANVAKFEPESGTVELAHNKRRGGAKRKSFAFEVKLVSVSGYPQPIPIVTGKVLSKAEIALNVPFDKVVRKFIRSANAELALNVLTEQFPRGGLRQEWLDAWQTAKGGPKIRGASEDTFDRAKDELVSEGVVEADSKGKGAIYRVKLQPGPGVKMQPGTEGKVPPQDSPQSAPPKGGADDCGGSLSANTPQCGGNAEETISGRGFADTTEFDNWIPADDSWKPPDEDSSDVVDEAMEQLGMVPEGP